LFWTWDKSQPMEWHHSQSYCEWVMLVGMVPRGEMINSDVAYIRTLTKLRKHCKWVQPCKNPT
jgi:hypothetical protein